MTAQTTWKTENVEIKYATGATAPTGIQEYEKRTLKYEPGGEHNKKASEQTLATWDNPATLQPTHIIVVFSSSYQGDDFTGAPGSVLTIDDFQLNY